MQTSLQNGGFIIGRRFRVSRKHNGRCLSSSRQRRDNENRDRLEEDKSEKERKKRRKKGRKEGRKEEKEKIPILDKIPRFLVFESPFSSIQLEKCFYV